MTKPQRPGFVLGLLFSLAFSGPAVGQRAESGVYVLPSGLLAEVEAVALDGQWELHWGRLLAPGEARAAAGSGQYWELPGPWNELAAAPGGPAVGARGAATFRLVVRGVEAGRLLALKLPQIETAYRLWVDGELVLEKGLVSLSPDSARAIWQPSEVYFRSQADSLELVVQVSNYHHRKGGISNSIMLGQASSVSRLAKRSLGYESFLIGLMLIMSLYHFGLLFLRRKDRSSLYFGLFTLFAGTSSAVNGETIWMQAFPGFPFELLLDIDFLSNLGRISAFSLFVSLLFPGQFPPRFVRAINGVSGLFAIFIVLAPSVLHTRSFLPMMGFMGVAIVWLLVGLARAARAGVQGAGHSLVGFAFLAASAINDALVWGGVYAGPSLAAWGVFVFIFFQSFLLALRFSQAFEHKERLGRELDHINHNLEKLVLDRTAEIERQKEVLRAQSENLERVNQEMRAQKEVVDLANTKLRDSINYASRIQMAILPDAGLLDLRPAGHFVLWRPKETVSGDFHWAARVGDRLVLAVADCTGHGVPGAFMSMLGISLLNEIVERRHTTAPAQILEHLREGVKSALGQRGDRGEQQDGMDIALLSLRLPSLEASFAGARNPLYLLRGGQVEVFRGDRMPVGVYRREAPFSQQALQLRAGDQIYLFSDGLPDQSGGPQGRKFGQERLRAFLLSVAERPMPEQGRMLEAELDRWTRHPGEGMERHPQLDDMLVLGLRL